jgi:hypothetical protein
VLGVESAFPGTPLRVERIHVRSHCLLPKIGLLIQDGPSHYCCLHTVLCYKDREIKSGYCRIDGSDLDVGPITTGFHWTYSCNYLQTEDLITRPFPGPKCFLRPSEEILPSPLSCERATLLGRSPCEHCWPRNLVFLRDGVIIDRDLNRDKTPCQPFYHSQNDHYCQWISDNLPGCWSRNSGSILESKSSATSWAPPCHCHLQRAGRTPGRTAASMPGVER